MPIRRICPAKFFADLMRSPFKSPRYTLARKLAGLNSTECEALLYDASRMAGLPEIRKRFAPHGKAAWGRMLLCVLLLFPSLLVADVIYLKNGHKIVAQVTKEDEKQVYYEADGGEFAVPKSMVDHVEKSDARRPRRRRRNPPGRAAMSPCRSPRP